MEERWAEERGKSAGVLIAPFVNDYSKYERRAAQLMKGSSGAAVLLS